MAKKKILSVSNDIILNLKILAEEKESVRRKLVITAAKLAITAKKLAVAAKEKESVRRKLVVTAKEKENVRRKLALTASKLAITAKKLAVTAKEKEIVRRKLAVTAAKFAVTASKLVTTAKKLAVTAKEKESVRWKLAITAKEKENVRRKLALTAAKLAITAKKLAVTAEKLAATADEKEIVRRKLVIAAAQLATTAEEKEVVRRKLAITAKEKEIVRRKLVITAREKEIVRRKLLVTAEQLKMSYETLEKKVLERTKDLEMARVKEEAILLSIGDGLIVTDKKGKITIINRTAEKLLGKDSKEVVGKVFSDAINLEDDKGVPILLEKHPVNMALATSITATGSNYYYLRKDKSKFPMSIMATPVILEGEVIGAIKIFRDITYERDIDKAKTEFVSLASHQLRTPLSMVNWYTEMLLAGDVGELNQKQTKYLGGVYRSNQRMVELVNALLDVASLELGTFVIEPKATNICKLAEDVIDEQKIQIKTKKITFSFLCKKDISLVKVDPKLLRMVMQNILSNAVKYTPEGGKIRLSISLIDKKNIQIKISDNGYGIPKNQQNKIFTKLFRADNVRDKDTDGTGLGLYIAKSIVENSGGKIWFSSPPEKEKKGTTFYVVLPLNGKKESNK